MPPYGPLLVTCEVPHRADLADDEQSVLEVLGQALVQTSHPSKRLNAEDVNGNSLCDGVTVS